MLSSLFMSNNRKENAALLRAFAYHLCEWIIYKTKLTLSQHYAVPALICDK